MLKVVFIGSLNEFNEVLVHWLSRRTDLAGVIWTTSVDWRRSWKGPLKVALERACR